MADDYTIISRAHIRAKAQSHYKRGKDRDSHGFNPGSSAIATFQLEWDRLATKDNLSVARADNQRFVQCQEHR